MMGMDGLDGYWMENMLVWVFFLDGFGVGPWFLDDLEWILRDFGCMLGWFLDGFWWFWKDFGWALDGFVMDVAWRFVFLCFRDFLILCFFEVDCTFMAKFMAKFWQSLAGLWQNCSKAVAELWQRDSEVMVELCLALYCTDASNRCTVASNRCT